MSKNTRVVKGRNQDVCESPAPNKKNSEENFTLHLRDLSPFPQIYSSLHLLNTAYSNPSELRFIETPADRTFMKPYLDQVDEGFRQISGVITWEQNDSSAQSASYQESEESYTSSVPPSQIIEDSEDMEENSCFESVDLEEKKIIDKNQESEMIRDFSKKSPNSAQEKTVSKKRVICNCKKTKCLKLYCDCFRQGLTCTEECNCVGCHNLDTHEQERNSAMLALIDRNPLAFIPKIDTEKNHSKGCHCKKSNCQKKYCECFQAGIKCGDNCKCEGCKNQGPTDDSNDPQNIMKCTAKKQKKFQEWIQGKI